MATGDHHNPKVPPGDRAAKVGGAAIGVTVNMEATEEIDEAVGVTVDDVVGDGRIKAPLDHTAILGHDYQINVHNPLRDPQSSKLLGRRKTRRLRKSKLQLVNPRLFLSPHLCLNTRLFLDPRRLLLDPQLLLNSCPIRFTTKRRVMNIVCTSTASGKGRPF